MIKLHGLRNSDEFKAGEYLEKKFLDFWPDLKTSEQNIIHIHTEAPIYGNHEQLDIVIFAKLPSGIPYECPEPIETVLGTQSSRIIIKNFVMVLEVKGHTGEKWRTSSGGVQVHTAGMWSDATMINKRQSIDLNRFLKNKNMTFKSKSRAYAPWATRMVFLNNETNNGDSDLNLKLEYTLFNDDSAEVLFRSLAEQFCQRATCLEEINETKNKKLIYEARSCPDKLMEDLLTGNLFPNEQPTRLDKKKMEMLSNRTIAKVSFEDIGKKPIIFSGKGGTGKTIKMLAAAIEKQNKTGKRALFLTYNLALLSDVRRLMQFKGIVSMPESGGLSTRSVIWFIGRAIKAYDEDFDLSKMVLNDLKTYKHKLSELVSLLVREPARSRSYKNKLMLQPEIFNVDLIFIDEGQDWLDDEILFLKHIYGEKNLCVAHGTNQLIRSSSEKTWFLSGVRKIPSIKAVRQKVSIVNFIRKFSEELGLTDWGDYTTEDDAKGGDVFIVEGDFFKTSLQAKLEKQYRKDITWPVDQLYLVPNEDVKSYQDKENLIRKESKAKIELENLGFGSWDAVDQIIRQEPPSNPEEYRVLNYQSCRGLEGWMTVCLGFDSLWNEKLKEFEIEQNKNDLFVDELLINNLVAQWMLIPLTRAMDTLVIEIRSGDSKVGQALKNIYKQDQGNIITWVNANLH